MKACCVHRCGRTFPCRSGLSPAGSGGWGTYVVGGPESLQLEVALQAVPEARLKLIGQPRHPFEPRTRQQRLHRLQVLTEREKGQNAFDLPQNIKLLQLLWATFLLIKKKMKKKRLYYFVPFTSIFADSFDQINEVGTFVWVCVCLPYWVCPWWWGRGGEVEKSGSCKEAVSCPTRAVTMSAGRGKEGASFNDGHYIFTQMSFFWKRFE